MPVRTRLGLADALVHTGRGDRKAFADVYALTSAKLYGICLRVCGERGAAEDVLYDVYLIVWRRADTWNPGLGTPITWLATIARNRSIDWRRANRWRTVTVPIDDHYEVADPAVDAVTALLCEERARQLRACLGLLDVRTEGAIRSAFFDGLTYTELAERQGVPLGTMKS